MYTVKKTFRFDAAHRLEKLRHHPCARFHGHTYKVELVISAMTLLNEGMIADLDVLKKMVMDKYDHRYLNDVEESFEGNPTAERVAEDIFWMIQNSLPVDTEVRSVTVWETPDACAIYTRQDTEEQNG